MTDKANEQSPIFPQKGVSICHPIRKSPSCIPVSSLGVFEFKDLTARLAVEKVLLDANLSICPYTASSSRLPRCACYKHSLRRSAFVSLSKNKDPKFAIGFFKGCSHMGIV